MNKTELEALLSTLDAWLIVFGVVVAIGVAGEAIVGFIHFRKGGQLQRLQATENLNQEHEIERLKKESASLRLDTTKSAERIAKAEEAVAKANETAERERLARLKIEGKFAPRHLAIQQVTAIALRLRRFHGQRVNFFAYSGDTEIVAFANDILGALTGPIGAGWNVTVSFGQEFGALMEGGIDVEVQADADTTSLAAANALVEALKSEGQSVTGPHVAGVAHAAAGALRTDPNAKIRIVIGKKP